MCSARPSGSDHVCGCPEAVQRSGFKSERRISSFRISLFRRRMAELLPLCHTRFQTREAPAMCTPPKRTQWREDLQHFRKEHGFSKKVLLNCCLVRRIISWASPNTKGRAKNTSPSCCVRWMSRAGWSRMWDGAVPPFSDCLHSNILMQY